VPARSPVLFLTRGAAVPGGLALRANFEILQMAHNLAPLVAAKSTPVQRLYAEPFEEADYIMLPCRAPRPRPIYHAGQDIRGDFVPGHDASRHGDPGGLPHVPNLAGVWLVYVHASGESQARVGFSVLGSLAQPLRRPPLTARDAAP